MPGYVALLDVLGFSALIHGDRDKRLQRYLETLQSAFEGPDDGATVEYVVFSDSIIVTTENDSEASFVALLRRCSKVFYALLENEFPLRGAISHGDFVRRETKGRGVFVAGKPIVDAYRFEKAQNWVGILIAPTALTRFPDLASRCNRG